MCSMAPRRRPGLPVAGPLPGLARCLLIRRLSANQGCHMNRFTAMLRQVHTTAGPAGTLLLVSVLLALLTTFARATPEAAVPERLTPGAPFTIAVALPEQGRIEAYLPGLDLQRVALRFDEVSGRYIGELTLPWYAPPRGRATLRIIGEGLSIDRPLLLGPADRS